MPTSIEGILRVAATSIESVEKLLRYVKKMEEDGLIVNSSAELREMANQLRDIPDLPTTKQKTKK